MKKKNKDKNWKEEQLPTKEQVDDSVGNFGEVMRLAQIGLKCQFEDVEVEKSRREEIGVKGLNAISFVAQFLAEVDKHYKAEVEEQKK